MKRANIVVLSLLVLASFAVPASAAQYDGLTMDVSQSYMRLGFNDTIVLTVQLTDSGVPTGLADKSVALNFRTGGEYVIFGNNVNSQLIATNSSGTATATIRLNPENQPERFRLPLQVMVEAIATDNDNARCNLILYITSSGSIFGYVVDDSTSTITNAKITVLTPDGKAFRGGTYTSSDGSGSPMGYYRIDNLPVEMPGKNTLTAEKNGYSGTLKAEAGFEFDNIRQDIVIHGFKDSLDVTSIVAGNANITATPVPTSGNTTDIPARPTTMTTTIIIAIAIIALVYLGLKAYRRMF